MGMSTASRPGRLRAEKCEGADTLAERFLLISFMRAREDAFPVLASVDAEEDVALEQVVWLGGLALGAQGTLDPLREEVVPPSGKRAMIPAPP